MERKSSYKNWLTLENLLFTILVLLYFSFCYVKINENTHFYKSILIYPFIMVLFLIFIDLIKNKFVSLDYKFILRRVISIPLFFFGSSWLVIFIKTNYRAGQKNIGIAVGLIFIIIGLILNFRRVK